jgi:hypothetical protein
MSVFDPELAARMKMPKELLDRAGDLHFAMHIGDGYVHASLFDFVDSTCLWGVQSAVPAGMAVEKFVYQRNWLEGVYRRCTISFDCDQYTLVPRSLFDENAVSDYLNLQHGSEQGATECIEIPEAEVVLCFVLPLWYSEIMRFFPNARLMPLSAFITKAAASKFQHQLQCIIAAVTPEHVTLACIRNKTLLLLSTQEAKTSDDVLYHLSNAAMRLELDLENCAVELVASAGRDELITLLRRYVKEVKIVQRTEVTNCSAYTQLHYLCA